jgi:GntR family transcriptional repressor for pyruvate dehydrogenase complex
MPAKIYEQLATRLRGQILDGELPAGSRLPSENELATEHGVGRSTVREALRLLGAQDLIRTTKGPLGGSFVTIPSASRILDSLHSSIELLTSSRDVTLWELLEARELLEVPAAGLAAQRRRKTDLDRLQETIPDHPSQLPTADQFIFNRNFHSCVIDTCGNTLLSIAAQPVFRVLQTHLTRSTLGANWHRSINVQHRGILEAIRSGDSAQASSLMHEHLAFLRPHYEGAWRKVVRDLEEE